MQFWLQSQSQSWSQLHSAQPIQRMLSTGGDKNTQQEPEGHPCSRGVGNPPGQGTHLHAAHDPLAGHALEDLHQAATLSPQWPSSLTECSLTPVPILLSPVPIPAFPAVPSTYAYMCAAGPVSCAREQGHHTSNLCSPPVPPPGKLAAPHLHSRGVCNDGCVLGPVLLGGGIARQGGLPRGRDATHGRAHRAAADALGRQRL